MSRAVPLVLLALALSAHAGVRGLSMPRRPRLGGRVVGGAPADISQFPWQLYFSTGGSGDCGASIVSSIYALTTARCVVDGDVESMRVRAGSSSRGSGGAVYAVTVIFWHASYDGRDNDIGALRVSEPFAFGPGVQPVPVSWNETAVGTAATVAGWGASSADGGGLPSQLQAATVEILDTSACNATYGNLTANMICAGASGGRGACTGDEGGALVSGSQQVGIVSWAGGCGQPGYPGVYTYIFPLRNWVYGILGV